MDRSNMRKMWTKFFLQKMAISHPYEIFSPKHTGTQVKTAMLPVCLAQSNKHASQIKDGAQISNVLHCYSSLLHGCIICYIPGQQICERDGRLCTDNCIVNGNPPILLALRSPYMPVAHCQSRPTLPMMLISLKFNTVVFMCLIHVIRNYVSTE